MISNSLGEQYKDSMQFTFFQAKALIFMCNLDRLQEHNKNALLSSRLTTIYRDCSN